MSKKRRGRPRKKKSIFKIKSPLILLVPFIFFVLIFSNITSKNNKEKKHIPIKKIENKKNAKYYYPIYEKQDFIEYGPRDKKKIALTFDADMTYGMIDLLKNGTVKSWFNKDVIDTLKKENTKATIFLTGLWTETYPRQAREIAQNPLFEIGNHTYSHPAFTQNCYKLEYVSNPFLQEEEIKKAQEVIKKVTGITPKYFRFPGGCHNEFDLKEVSKYGLKTIQWDVASGDAFGQNPDEIVQKVESQAQNGSIIVFHLHGGIYAPKTNDALIKIIPYLKKQGYELSTISELLSF